MKKGIAVMVAAALLFGMGCGKDIDNVTVGQVKEAAVEQSKAALESVKTLTAAVSEEEFNSEAGIVKIVAKRGLALANVDYDIDAGTLSYSVDGTDYRYMKGTDGAKAEYVIDMMDSEKDIQGVETFLTDKAASQGFISAEAVAEIMETVKDTAQDKTITFDGGESTISRKDGRVVIRIRF